MELFFTGILILLLGGVFSLVFKEERKAGFLAFSSIAALIPLFLSAILKEDSFEFFAAPFGNVIFTIDNLSAFFVIVISVISTLISIYSIGYLKPYVNKGKKISSHCLFLPILTAAMLMVVTVQNALLFLVIWELMSLSSFFLILFEDDKKEVISTAIKYMIYMHISVLFIIAAFAVMSAYAGTYDISAFSYIFEANPILKDVVFLLAFIGFGTKAGFVPMHNWLPDAHPQAQSHVSALMSAVMIKTGIYGILRVLCLIGKPTVFMDYTVLIISVITALYGITYAVNQKNIKKLLAYSSIENIGLIGLAMSIMMFGITNNDSLITSIGTIACFMHILNHSVFKSLLFMGAGSVYLKTHTKNMEALGGLIKKMPCTAACFLTGALAICAFPPFNGFVSEFMIYTGLFRLLQTPSSVFFITVILSIAALALVGTLVILAMSKVFSIVFLGLPRSEHSKNVTADSDLSMRIPMVILAGIALLIGVFPLFFTRIIPISLFNAAFNLQIAGFMLPTELFFITFIGMIFIALTAFIVLLKKLISPKHKEYETWGCGYDKGNNHIQYTGASYISPLTSILTPLLKKIFDVKKPKGFFPKDAHYNSSVQDVEEALIINPVLKTDEKFLSKFERLQDGNIQHYILYGLIFLILMLAGVVFWK